MANPNDLTRDAILRHLYDVHSRAKSPRTTGLMIRELAKALRAKGLKQREVASNLDYLVQKGWVREVVESRTFTTPRGTTQQSERRFYKISDSGIDRIEAASIFERTPMRPHINISSVSGVTVVGDGNVVNTSFTDLSRALSDMRTAVLAEPELGNQQRLEVVADLESLQAQLQKPRPDTSVIRTLWSGLEKAAAVGGVVDLVRRVGELIRPLVS